TPIPEGLQPVLVDGQRYEGNFAKIALNALRGPEGNNELPRILRGWFGPDAGKSGTNFLVACEPTEDGVVLRPAAGHEGSSRPQLWKRYSREQIPPLFGERFSDAIWNAGFISSPKNLFLLVTLEKGEMLEDHQYADHFLSPSLFQWQSQNRTAQRSKHGELIREHR